MRSTLHLSRQLQGNPVDRGPEVGLFRRHKIDDKVVDPLSIALDVTLADLRRVALELQETADAVRERVERSKEKQRE